MAERGDLIPDEIFKISEQPQIPAYLEPIKLIADTLGSGDLTLFIYAENYHHVIPVPAICVHAVLEKVGLLHRTRDTIILRFKNFFPLLHDLRRTCVSGMARLGIAPHVADKILNHQSGTISGVAAVYQRHEFLAERRAALNLWGAHVAELIKVVVVPERRIDLKIVA